MSTHTQMTATTIRSSIVVNAPIDRAFRVFTEDFGAFKPRLAQFAGGRNRRDRVRAARGRLPV